MDGTLWFFSAGAEAAESMPPHRRYLHYAGRFYPERMRAAAVVLEAMKTEPGLRLLIRSLGPPELEKAFTDEARRLGVMDRVHVLQPCSPGRVAAEADHAVANLVLDDVANTYASSRGVLTGKFLELVARRRPVLAVTQPASEMGPILSATKKGRVCTTAADVRGFIRDVDDGTLPAEGDAAEIARYSKASQAAVLAGVLDTIIAHKRPQTDGPDVLHVPGHHEKTTRFKRWARGMNRTIVIKADLSPPVGRLASHVSLNTICSFEAFFLLFLMAGRYKGDPRFQWIAERFSLDLTVLFLLLSGVMGLAVLLGRGYRLPRSAAAFTMAGGALFGYMSLALLWTPGDVYAHTKALHIGILNHMDDGRHVADNRHKAAPGRAVSNSVRALRGVAGCGKRTGTQSKRRRIGGGAGRTLSRTGTRDRTGGTDRPGLWAVPWRETRLPERPPSPLRPPSRSCS